MRAQNTLDSGGENERMSRMAFVTVAEKYKYGVAVAVLLGT